MSRQWLPHFVVQHQTEKDWPNNLPNNLIYEGFNLDEAEDTAIEYSDSGQPVVIKRNGKTLITISPVANSPYTHIYG